MTHRLGTPRGPESPGVAPASGIPSVRPSIGERIRCIREKLGLTQEKLASRLGVAFPTVNRWENGRTQPSPLALKQLEALLADTENPAVGLADHDLSGARRENS